MFAEDLKQLSANFEELANEWDSMRQKLNCLDMAVKYYTYPHSKEIKDIKTRLKVIEDCNSIERNFEY